MPDAPRRQFLLRPRPVELARARAHPALARLARELRERGLATGLDYVLSDQPTCTVADATHTLPG